jgi:hypothetical protein
LSCVTSVNPSSIGDFPLLSRLVDSDMELDLDQLFEFDLGRLLDGLQQYMASRVQP